ncbi:MAG: hypothetical protein ACK4YO_03890, partial [Candidatus Altarchaeaceae archaeon]
ENMLKNLIDKTREFYALIEKYKKPERLYICIAEDWKRELFIKIKEGKNIGEIMKDEKFRKYGDTVVKIFNKYHKDKIKIVPTSNEEFEFINSAKEFLEKELNLKVEILNEIPEIKEINDKAKFAMPLEPAVVLM